MSSPERLKPDIDLKVFEFMSNKDTKHVVLKGNAESYRAFFMLVCIFSSRNNNFRFIGFGDAEESDQLSVCQAIRDMPIGKGRWIYFPRDTDTAKINMQKQEEKDEPYIVLEFDNFKINRKKVITLHLVEGMHPVQALKKAKEIAAGIIVGSN